MKKAENLLKSFSELSMYRKEVCKICKSYLSGTPIQTNKGTILVCGNCKAVYNKQGKLLAKKAKKWIKDNGITIKAAPKGAKVTTTKKNPTGAFNDFQASNSF